MITLNDKTKIAVMAILLTACLVCIYYFHFILHRETIFTHLFYIPIILGSIWWKRKGIAVAAFLMALLIFSHNYEMDLHGSIFDDLLRGSMFVVIAIVVSVLSDHLRKSEGELRETGDYLEKLITHANAPIIVWNPELIITRFNNAFEHLTGYEANEVVGRGLTILFPETSKDKALYKIEQTLTGEKWESVEIPILCVSGDIRTILWNSANIHSSDGKYTIATIAQGQDITKRKEAEEALMESNDRFHTLANSTFEGLIIHDKGEILDVNKSLLQMIGYESDELIGKNVMNFIAPESRELVARQLQTGSDNALEIKVKVKDGPLLTMEAAGKTIFYKDNPARVVALHDITERKEAEELLRHTLEELKRNSQELEETSARLKISSETVHKMNEELEIRVGERTRKLAETQSQLFQTSKLATLGEMSAGLVHEINQPLSGIALTTENMRKLMEGGALTSAEIEDSLQDIESSFTRMSRIIQHIRTFARQDTFEFVKVDVNEVIGNTMELLGEQLRSHGIEVIKEYADDLPTIEGEPYQIQQVLINLLTNARDALDEKGQNNSKDYSRKITCKTEKIKDDVCIAISDNGIGMTEEQKEKIFQPFFTTKEAGKETGLGLGMSISYGIIETHKGRFEIESARGEGTTIKVFFR